VHLSSGQRCVLGGIVAEMVERLAEHAADIQRHDAGCVELHFVPGSVKVKLRVDLQGPKKGRG